MHVTLLHYKNANKVNPSEHKYAYLPFWTKAMFSKGSGSTEAAASFRSASPPFILGICFSFFLFCISPSRLLKASVKSEMNILLLDERANNLYQTTVAKWFRRNN